MSARHAITAFSGTRLRELRRERGLSQERLAEALVAQSEEASTATAVTRERLKLVAYEAGTRQPRAEGLHAMARALGVDARALLDPAAPVTLELLRALQQLTQGDVAQELGIGQARYSQLENGHGAIEPDRLDRLAAILRITPADLAKIVPTRPRE